MARKCASATGATVAPECQVGSPYALRRRPGRRLATNKNLVLRLPAFIGCLLLLYTVATGLSATVPAGESTLTTASQHGLTGIIGTVLCAAGIVLLSRRRTP